MNLKIHTLIVYSIPKIPKFKYRIEQTASNPLPTLKNTHSHCVSTSKNHYCVCEKFFVFLCDFISVISV